MTQMHWLMAAVAVLAAVVGFLTGRLTAPREKQYQETRAELDRVQRERDDLRASVEDHFQSTAALFGNLSRDYRALYLHFAEGARSLGLGEEPARKLIEEARAPAAGEDPAAGDIAGETAQTTAAGTHGADAPDTDTATTDTPGPAGEEETPTPAAGSPEELAEERDPTTAEADAARAAPEASPAEAGGEQSEEEPATRRESVH